MGHAHPLWFQEQGHQQIASSAWASGSAAVSALRQSAQIALKLVSSSRNIGIGPSGKRDCALPGSGAHLSTIQGVRVLAYLCCSFFIAECQEAKAPRSARVLVSAEQYTLSMKGWQLQSLHYCSRQQQMM